jgi:predicted nucleic acid-binding protein
VPQGDLFILDACVLIDYVDADVSVLGEMSRHLGRIHVAATVLEEVGQLDESRAGDLGLIVVEPGLELLADAATRGGGLSLQDHVCLMLAQREGWTCVTSDAALREACVAVGVGVLWGLEPMALMVEHGHMAAEVAIEVAERIAASNPYITAEIVARFTRRVHGGGSR